MCCHHPPRSTCQWTVYTPILDDADLGRGYARFQGQVQGQVDGRLGLHRLGGERAGRCPDGGKEGTIQDRVGAPDALSVALPGNEAGAGEAVEPSPHGLSADRPVFWMQGGQLLVGALGPGAEGLGMFLPGQLAEQHVGAKVAVGDLGLHGHAEKGWRCVGVRFCKLPKLGLVKLGFHGV